MTEERVMVGQRSLYNFYASVRFSQPKMAALMSEDIIAVALYSLAEDKSPAQESVDRLRQRTRNLPVVLNRVLESALSDLGYS